MWQDVYIKSGQRFYPLTHCGCISALHIAVKPDAAGRAMAESLLRRCALGLCLRLRGVV
jgi:hypothetical protein